jgi:hypothetical protein
MQNLAENYSKKIIALMQKFLSGTKLTGILKKDFNQIKFQEHV